MSSKKTIGPGLIICVCVVIAILFVIAVPACSYNNTFVDLSQNVDQSWAEVQNTYQRRADLIPNLVNTVKGYAAHEKSTLQGVTDARAGLDKALANANAVDANANPSDAAYLEQYSQAQQNLRGAYDIYINAVHEAYPELKADRNFLDLQTQIEGTENRITEARRDYTKAVAEYNKAVLKFPGKLFAGILGYGQRPQFQAAADAQAAPKVDFTE